jgi:hypothetical protein
MSRLVLEVTDDKRLAKPERNELVVLILLLWGVPGTCADGPCRYSVTRFVPQSMQRVQYLSIRVLPT